MGIPIKSSLDICGNISTSGDSSVFAGSGSVPIYVRSTGTVSYVQLQNSTTGSSSTSDGLTVGVNGSTGYVWLREAATLHLGTNDTAAISIDSSQEAKFLGNARLPAGGYLYTWTGHDDNYLKYDLWRASASAGMTIHNISADGEIYLKSGNATTLTLDSSQDAAFAGAVSLTGGALSISGDGSNAATLTETSAGILTIATVDDFVVDAGGDITLDADGGDIRLKDAGNTFGFFNSTSDHFYIGAGTQDKDIIFQGNDGGSQINVLTLDMSAAGAAFFNHDIVLVDNGKVTFGGGSDLQIYHDGSNNYIHSTTSDQDINILGNDGGSTITALTFDMSAAGAATFNSTIATSDVYGASSLRLAALGGTAYLDATASVILRTNGTTTALTLDTSQNATFAGTITTSAGTSSIYNRLKIWDNTNQINIGQWDGANHRMEFDANRPVLITSYQGNINLGISGGTTLNVHSSGIVVTGQTKSTTGWFTDNVYLSGGQLYIGASGANATTDDSHRLR